MSNLIIEVINLLKEQNKEILDVKNLNVVESEIFGIIDPDINKCNLITKSLLNLVHKDSGTINIFNHSIDKDFNKIISDIGYIPYNDAYYKKMTVKEFFNYSKSFHKADYSTNIENLVELFGLDTTKKISMLTLSERRVITIINALFHEPRLIIMEDPLLNLDSLARKTFITLIKHLHKLDKTIVYTSTNLDLISITDNVYLFNENITLNQLKDGFKDVRIKCEELDDKFINYQILNYKEENGESSFLYRGDINNLIKKLNNYTLSDIEITEPSLEEVYKYYENKDI